MNRIMSLYFVASIIILMASISVYAHTTRSIQSILVQKNGAIVSFEKAINNERGSVSVIAGTDSYLVNVHAEKFMVDFKSSQSVSAAFFSIFPANVKVNILFVSVQPDRKIYFDGNYLNIMTDSKGNADIEDFYPEPGPHTIELKGNGFVPSNNVKLVINVKSTIKCTGEKQMICSVLNG